MKEEKTIFSFINCHSEQLKQPLVTNPQLELDSSDLSLPFLVPDCDNNKTDCEDKGYEVSDEQLYVC